MYEPARRFAFAVAAVAASLSAAAIPLQASAQAPYLRVSTSEPKYTAIVMDARTGEILYGQRADSPRYPASVTKVMTFYLIFEALAAGRLHLNDQVVISPLAAAQPPTKLGLRAGETITVEDAMHGMAVHSANDMAMALAERVGGNEANFAAMMTEKARQLGMANTRYVNPNGLPDSRQISSAHDIAILTRALLRDYPQYYRFFSQEQFTFRGRTYENTNHLLGKMPGVDGLKTGFTNAAGFNLDASAVRNGNRLIVVVMGSSSSQVRNANVEGLLLTGFDVLERRARGERITVAQNMFEQGPQAYAAARRLPYAISPGSDRDDDPIDVVLTRSTVRPASLMVSDSMAAASARVARPEPHTWWVQLGEYRSRRAAKAQVEHTARQFARLLDDAEGSVDGRAGAYRARFSGLTPAAAKEACSAVKSERLSCTVGGPA